ncbi:hypothetical protein JQC92_15720 [Shewanella sp. 202IG2-18]|uniref:hypothetical protein n=1 Tax=Parashewanella hymeniacidonis TaxID=2807618 RepID=UPI0019614B8D|nr:hypothetical protein [Parashewanella hymeniacidonis]MBM7073462.1 hypothetical protein [Parashewanella hymeniacidonis]
MHSIHFFDKENLYRNIFPKNNFETCEFEVHMQTSEADIIAGSLQDICWAFEHIEKRAEALGNLDDAKRYNEVLNLIGTIRQLGSMIKVDFIKSREFGDVFYNHLNELYVFNLFTPDSTLNTYRDVVSKLLLFTNNSKLPSDRSLLSTSYFRDPLLNLVIDKRPQVGLGFHNLQEYHFDYLIKCYNVFKNNRDIREINSEYIELSLILTDKNNAKELVQSEARLCKVIEKTLDSLNILLKKESNNQYLEKLAFEGSSSISTIKSI